MRGSVLGYAQGGVGPDLPGNERVPKRRLRICRNSVRTGNNFFGNRHKQYHNVHREKHQRDNNVWDHRDDSLWTHNFWDHHGNHQFSSAYSNTTLGQLLGEINEVNQFGLAGRLYFDGAGHIDAQSSTSGGTVLQVGTYTVNPDCSITVSLTDAFGTNTTATNLVGLILGDGTGTTTMSSTSTSGTRTTTGTGTTGTGTTGTGTTGTTSTGNVEHDRAMRLGVSDQARQNFVSFWLLRDQSQGLLRIRFDRRCHS